MINIIRPRVVRNIWVAILNGRSQKDFAAKSCPAHTFVIWDQILKLSHRNNHHIEPMCREQDLGQYLKGQGHIITLLQKRLWPITLLFEVGF